MKTKGKKKKKSFDTSNVIMVSSEHLSAMAALDSTAFNAPPQLSNM